MQRNKTVRLELALAALPLLAFGWGAGHDTVARTVSSRLPPPWPERLQGEAWRQLCADSHYPDSFEPFAVERVGAENLDGLKRQGLAKRYDLHSDKGRAVAFCQLVRALNEKRHDRALLWLACLAHSTADMAACNHDPVVHIATYGWGCKAWGMKLPGGKPLAEIVGSLDLGWVKDETFGRHVDAALLRDSGGDAGEALLEIMLYGVRGAEACAPHGPLVLSAAAEWADTGKSDVPGTRTNEGATPNAEQRTPSAEVMDEPAARLGSELSALGAWATGRILRDFHVALRLAGAGQVPEVTPDVLARYETEMDRFVAARPLSSDVFAQAALAPSVATGQRIGVMIEPCWRMNEGMFGFGDRVLAVQIVNALRRQGRPAELVDVRRFLEKGTDVAALIVPAQRCGSYRTLKVEALDKRLADYLDAGGKVVWVGGGKPPGALCKGMPKVLWVKAGDRSWPVPLEKFRAGGLFAVGGTERKLARDPEGQAGWHWPSNPYAVAAECAGDVRTLLAWRGSGEERIVGAAWPKGRPNVSYLPSYAVAPYFWTQETPALAPLRLELDQAGTELVKAALESVE